MKTSMLVTALGLAGLGESIAAPTLQSLGVGSRNIQSLVRRQEDWSKFQNAITGLMNDAFAAIPGILTRLTTKLKAVQTVELQPSGKRAGAKRMKVKFGPHILPPKGVLSPLEFIIQFDPSSKTWAQPVEFPGDMTVLFSEHYLEYEDGTRANASNGVYSHHTFYMDIFKGFKSAWTCPGMLGDFYPQITLMGIMNNQGEDNLFTSFTDPEAKLNAGYYIGPNDYVLSAGEVINYNKDEKKIYVVADLEYLPGRQPGFYDSTIQALFVSGCDWMNVGGAMSLSLPLGQKKHTFKSKEMMFAEDGYLVNMVGHLHDGGINMVLKMGNQTVCDSRAIYGSPESGHGHSLMGMGGSGVGAGKEYQGIVGMTECNKPIQVKKGDLYTIEATIDFEQRPPRTQVAGVDAEVMGMFSAMFARKTT